MVSLSLDSNVVVDIFRNRRPVRDFFVAARERGDLIVVSTLVLHELAYGAWRSDRAEPRLRELDLFLPQVVVENFDSDDALSAARLRADLTNRGGPMGAYDELIAAQALQRGWTMVTSNLRHFLLVENLTLIDWRESDRPIDRTHYVTQHLRRPSRETK